ncbi:MAG: hypothetical protein HY925_14465, partial [Elusimicrobia bacterium]|nr:hypothetical protein [Elusimicrobiota bacterium]
MKSVLAVAFVLSCFPYKARAEFDAVEFLGAARAQAAASNAPIAASTKHKIVVEAEEGLTVTLKSATSGFTARNEHRLRCGHLDVDAGVGDVFEPYFRASRQANYKGAPALVSPAGPGAWLVGSDPKKEGGRCNYVSNGQYLRFSVEGPGISD